LTHEKQTVTDSKPVAKPMGIGLPEIQQAVEQANGKRRTLDESDDNKMRSRVLAANRSNVVQSPQAESNRKSSEKAPEKPGVRPEQFLSSVTIRTIEQCGSLFRIAQNGLMTVCSRMITLSCLMHLIFGISDQCPRRQIRNSGDRSILAWLAT
jgi:hypothetical protein